MADPYSFETNPAKPAIYSPRVVQVFSALFSGLAGGILTFYSLQAVGQLAAARQALWASIGFAVFTAVFVSYLSATNGFMAVVLGNGWGYFLIAQYFKKYLPDEASYPRKSWVKPLIIWLVIVALGLAVIIKQLAVLGDGSRA